MDSDLKARLTHIGGILHASGPGRLVRVVEPTNDSPLCQILVVVDRELVGACENRLANPHTYTVPDTDYRGGTVEVEETPLQGILAVLVADPAKLAEIETRLANLPEDFKVEIVPITEENLAKRADHDKLVSIVKDDPSAFADALED